MSSQRHDEESTTPTPSIDEALGTVSQRICRRNVCNVASIGLVVGCFAALILACLVAAGVSVSGIWLAASILTSVGIGGLVGLLRPSPPSGAARVVDSYYVMKDRAITALQFQHDTESVRQLQVDDARQHMRHVRAGDCVKIKPNRPMLWSASILAMLAGGIFFLAGMNQPDVIAARPIGMAVDQASQLRKTMLEEIAELQEEVDQPELEVLLEEVEQLVDELEESSINEQDMMATLSEMEQVINEALDAMQLEMTDAQMLAIADALRSADAMKSAAAAMREGEYDKASENLQKIDPNEIGDKERRAVADNLKKFLAQLSPGNRGQLSSAAQQIQAGLEGKNAARCKAGIRMLAQLCKKQSNCKNIGKCMACQLNRLSQCKSQCRGQSDSIFWAKSKTPSLSAGKAATGNPNDGESTRLDSTRRQEQLTGVQGDGESESEVIQSSEGEQEAARAYSKRYQKFRSEAEAVLLREPLPLGHRETVRQYFENIRPSTQDAAFYAE